MDKEFSDFISNVLDKTDIVSLISRYVKLDRRGNTYWACCPFHHESDPSFAVNAEGQFFHCFGCKEGGNALSFVMKIENLEFYDALKLLAEQAGLEMPAPKGGAYSRTDKKVRDSLYALMRDAAMHYHSNLSSPRAQRFNAYLEERRIPRNIVTRFGLGASLDYREMITYLQDKGYTIKQMVDAGIAAEDGSRTYDVFGERLMFPIIDNLGHVVAFGGRTLEKEYTHAKYRNSSQTVIFDKSNVIYGINLLKKRKAKAPIDSVIMTEGYMDVIALHKAGFDTAVASMGTALTVKQARQLKLYADKVYISYDGDTAGQKATMRGLDILRDTGLIVKVVRLPDGLDPDDIIKRGGAEAYQKLLDEAIPLTAYKIEVLKAKYDMADPDMKAKFAIEAVRIITELDNPVEREQYFEYVSKITSFTVEALKRQSDMDNNSTPKRPLRSEKTDRNSDGYGSNLEFYLASLLWGRDYVDYDTDVSGAMPDDFTRRLYRYCREKRKDAMKFYEIEFGEEEVAKINGLLNYRFSGNNEEQTFRDVEKKLYIVSLESELAAYRERFKTTSDIADLKQIEELSREIQSLRSTK